MQVFNLNKVVPQIIIMENHRKIINPNEGQWDRINKVINFQLLYVMRDKDITVVGLNQ